MRLAALIPVVALVACAPSDLRLKQQLPLAVQDQYAATFQDLPFDTGPVTVLTEEHGELHSYTLAPCHGGARVCANSFRGRAGSVVFADGHYVVRGTHAGRTFHLSPGGDGYMVRGGVETPLAWDDASARSRWAVTAVTDQGVGLALE